jgi:Cu(I)/Ag(I) efflux system membrane fusion protein
VNKTAIVAALLAVAAGFVAGHWLGSQQKVSEKAEAQPLFYRHPMNPSVTSPIPAKDEMGMDYLPVYAEEAAPAKAERKILYYRNPMGLPDTSPVPKQDNMGMDYLPVYADEAQAAGAVSLSPEKIQKLGVRTETVAKRLIAHTVRAVGTVQVDERRVVAVAPRFEGWIERLHVNATGQPVRKGQTLLDVYSPELLATAEEYRIARTSNAQDPLAEAARKRLRNFGVGEAFLNRPSSRSVSFVAPAGGVVLEKNAVEGMRFMAGETLYRIADLSRVWLLADVFEQDLAHIHEGHPATIRVDAWPEKVFQGKVAFIYPTVTPETRTARLRIELPNPEGLLKPAMYGSVELVAHPTHEAVGAVSDSAVIDSGVRQLVLVQKGEGTFEPRPVRLGKRVEGYAEILEGLAEGESVVVQANFLIDAESNLKAALGGFGGAAPGQGEQP